MERIFGFLPVQASTVAKDVDLVYLVTIAVNIFFGVLIAGLVIYFSLKYRRRSDDEVGAHIHGNLPLEIFWTIVPLVIALALFAWGAILAIHLFIPPKDAREIFVVGKQWMWKIQHPEGPREINELHIPINQPVKLLMTSEDVIHSFFVPAFRTKMDVVPGRYTQSWFEATKLGTYPLYCTEYCGTKHSQMIGRVIVQTPEDYQKWLAGERAPIPVNGDSSKGRGGKGAADKPLTLAEQGADIFTKNGCITCHSVTSTALGPSLEDLYNSKVTLTNGQSVTADEAYIRESILNPQAKVVAGYAPVMPTFSSQIDEEQILAIIAYIKSLQSVPPAAEVNNGENS